MEKIKIVKMVLGVIVSVGVGAIISNVIKTSTPIRVKPIMKACMYIGGVMLSGLVGDQAVKYAEQKVDEIVILVKDMVTD